MSGRFASSVPARLLGGIVVLVLAGWAAGEIWVASIGGAESDLMRDLAAERSHGLIELARVVTWLGSLWLLIPVGVVICILLLRAGLVIEAVGLALGLLGAILIEDATKGLVARPRPPVEHLQTVHGSSFPSSHATQASAFWVSLALALRAAGLRRRALAAVVAAVALVARHGRVVARVPGRALPLRCRGGPGARLGLGALLRPLPVWDGARAEAVR